MNFSSFVAPFAVTTAINNQFSSKFNLNADMCNGETVADVNNLVDDAPTFKANVESMMMAVSRYQSSNPRFSQQNLLNKYYRENYISEEPSVSSVNSISSSLSATTSLSLITSKLQDTDNFSALSYGHLRCGFPQQLGKQEQKRAIQNESIRIQNICNVIKKEEKEPVNENGIDISSIVNFQPQSQLQQNNISVASWQSIAAVAAAVAAVPTPVASTTTVADYLSHLPNSSIPLSLHSLFKYSTENVKKETDVLESILCAGQVQQSQNQDSNVFVNSQVNKKRKRKKPQKEKKLKPKPGEIRITTALDGSALYCCPECHMAYPDKNLLEQHLVGHTIERRFFCDICGAGLKRKDHLTRHKQSHNPDRPHACSVCTKAFKRKEQLALHYVIHSGEKRHVCPECGKGFYRKDHLRKHTRSHIARRVKAELSQYTSTSNNNTTSTSKSTS